MKVSALLLAATTTAAAVAGAACGPDRSATTAPSADAPIAAELAGLDVRGLGPAVQRDLARARAATARFHRFAEAEPAEYDFLFLDMCMELPGTGGMGFHYVDTTALDATLEVEHPEALLYEPGPNGQYRLVGLEYVVPAGAWASPNPPVLFGRELSLNQFGLWALHVWIWKRNPVDLFADWNPDVSCANAAPSLRGHH